MLGEYFRGMASGDPVAWIVTVAVIAVFAGGLAWDWNRRKKQ